MHEDVKTTLSVDEQLDVNKALAVVRLKVLFLTVKEVAQLIGVSESTIRNMSKAGNFPMPYKIDSRTRWKTSEVIEWADTLPKAETC